MNQHLALRTTALLALAALTWGIHARAEEPDPLQACWRSQQVRVFLRDGKHWDQNADCVSEIKGGRYRSQCASENGSTEIVSSWERVAPDRLRMQMLDAATGVAKGTPSELHFRVDGEWLLIDRDVAQPAGGAGGDKQPMRIQSVSRRVPAAGTCAPRGNTGLRIGRTPRSSLVLDVPPGWKPLLVDPVTDASLGAAVQSSLLVGVFTREPPAPDDRTRLVMVLDDVRPGPVPVREKEFGAVRAQFRKDLGSARILCDEADRICGSLANPDDTLVYTEIVNVAGRAVMVHATGQGQASLPALQRSAAVFVAQLRAGAGK